MDNYLTICKCYKWWWFKGLLYFIICLCLKQLSSSICKTCVICWCKRLRAKKIIYHPSLKCTGPYTTHASTWRRALCSGLTKRESTAQAFLNFSNTHLIISLNLYWQAMYHGGRGNCGLLRYETSHCIFLWNRIISNVSAPLPNYKLPTGHLPKYDAVTSWQMMQNISFFSHSTVQNH